jgi:hypothetical protein
MIPRGQEHIGECMRLRLFELKNTALRHLAVTGLVAGFALLVGAGGAFAQSGTPNPPDQAKQQSGNPADANLKAARESNQRKVEEFTEAQQAINGPAGNPECVWLGRRVVRLMYNDDLDTAFRHLDLYDRFGCPGGHVQAAFRCLSRFLAQIDDKVAGSLDNRIHSCWINPGAQPQAAAAASPTPAPSTAGNAAPAPAPAASPSPTPSASPTPAK